VVGAFDLDPNGVEGTVNGIIASGGQAVGFGGDVRDETAVKSALEALAKGARLWLVANVAGIGVAATVVETTDEQWQRVISVNLTGTFIVCRAAVPILLGSGGGVIVNVASAGGLVGIAERAA
jgi:NAD(P)-dependent dehydrogenase (short-subunit alcohol dehydrogenase family)